MTDLLPPFVACASMALTPAVGAVKRAREHAAGRLCAARALAAIGAGAAGVAVGANGEPIWPAEATGSISHTQRLAVAVAAPRTRARSIGVDVEPVISRSRLAVVRDRIAAPGEIERLAASAACDVEIAATLLFSAKESLYKCLFSEVGRVFDYLDAEVRHADLARRAIRLRLNATLSERWRRGAEIAGRATIDGDVVFTAVVLEGQDHERDARG